MMKRRPGGVLATRPLHFIWIADCSGSMKVEGKIQALNNAIREAIPHMREVALENPNATIYVRALRFSTGAAWHVEEPTVIHQFNWNDLEAEGITDLGEALTLVSEEMKTPPMSDRALPPVLALISDGLPTDDFEVGIQKLLDEPWGQKAVRIAISIGEDAAASDTQEVFRKFIANPSVPILQANNPESLVGYIRWVSTAVLQSASSPASQVASEVDPSRPVANVPLPKPPVPVSSSVVGDVW